MQFKNEYFDSETCPYVVEGFYEELLDLDNGSRVLGSRLVSAPDRKLGSDGRTIVILTENVTLQRGMKQVVVKASAKRPVRCLAMVQVLCGRKKNN